MRLNLFHTRDLHGRTVQTASTNIARRRILGIGLNRNQSSEGKQILDGATGATEEAFAATLFPRKIVEPIELLCLASICRYLPHPRSVCILRSVNFSHSESLYPH